MASSNPGPPPGGSAVVLGVFTVTIFVSAALLFLVQPLVARMILPRLGGSPAVWNTAVVFYQLALLGGYMYAYLSTRLLSARLQVLTQAVLLLLPLTVLPLGLPEGWIPRPDHPTTSVLAVLTVAVGLPFVVISTSAPLLQRWFVESGHPHGTDPYFLYASSNAGSLLALIAYPLLIERLLPLGAQARWWTVGYVAFATLSAICGVLTYRSVRSSEASSTRRSSTSPAPAADASPAWASRALWLALSAVPVSLMLSVTTYLTTDLSAVPLLWVIPLAIYLTTFIVAFARRARVPDGAVLAAAPVALAGLMFLIAAKEDSTERWLVACHLIAFLLIALACHQRLARLRPAPEHLTGFYLIVSLGGAVGGMFNALVAPVLFDHVYEYPLSLLLAALLLLPAVTRHLAPPARRWIDVVVPVGLGLISFALVHAWQVPDGPSTWPQRGAMFGLPLAVGLMLRQRHLLFTLTMASVFAASLTYNAGRGTLLLADRTFFGINRVVLLPSGRYHVLAHGNTAHGAQSLDPARRREPLTYFHPNGPLGQIFAAFNTAHPTGRVAVVGLGTGSIGCYRRPEQHWTFYELDPAVVTIARDTGLFTFLGECAPDASIIEGDARLSLQLAPTDSYDLILIDAFSSDAVPIHLITREAAALYLSKLAPGGLLVFNISNRHLELTRVLRGIARDLRLTYRHRDNLHIDPRLAGRGMMASQWAVLARTPDALQGLAADRTWVEGETATAVTWTDDFSNLLGVFKWD